LIKKYVYLNFVDYHQATLMYNIVIVTGLGYYPMILFCKTNIYAFLKGHQTKLMMPDYFLDEKQYLKLHKYIIQKDCKAAFFK